MKLLSRRTFERLFEHLLVANKLANSRSMDAVEQEIDFLETEIRKSREKLDICHEGLSKIVHFREQVCRKLPHKAIIIQGNKVDEVWNDFVDLVNTLSASEQLEEAEEQGYNVLTCMSSVFSVLTQSWRSLAALRSRRSNVSLGHQRLTEVQIRQIDHRILRARRRWKIICEIQRPLIIHQLGWERLEKIQATTMSQQAAWWREQHPLRQRYNISQARQRDIQAHALSEGNLWWNKHRERGEPHASIPPKRALQAQGAQSKGRAQRRRLTGLGEPARPRSKSSRSGGFFREYLTRSKTQRS